MSRPVFLSANWIHLVLVNFEVDPKILFPHLPVSIELDFFDKKTYVSLVAFLFENTKVFGFVPAFFHRDFEEINLRFYVVRRENNCIKRGVVFIKEIVPKPLLSWVARTFYHENYVSMPTSHLINVGRSYEYRWGGHHLRVDSNGTELETQEDSLERWITEHYWGYTKLGATQTLEYEVKHPLWSLYEVTNCELDIDFPNLYGKEFQLCMEKSPSSVFLAQGSKVSVHCRRESIINGLEGNAGITLAMNMQVITPLIKERE